MTTSNLTLTLIAPQGQNQLTDAFIQDLKLHLKTQAEPKWLAKNEALDIDLTIPTAQLEPLKNNITTYLAPHPIDYALQPSKNRRKKLLISDMDSTIIQEECIDEIAYLAGIKPKVAEITECAMRGEIDFDDALRERVSLLKDLETSALETVINERLHLSKGAKTLVQTMAKNGSYCALVSGGFTYFTDKIAALTGFHTTQANNLEIKDKKLTGQVIPPILGSAAKKTALENYIVEKQLTRTDTLAVGDGANDLDMITHAGLGVAYKAKPIVAAKADAAINHTDLTSLLYMQGYNKDEFVT